MGMQSNSFKKQERITGIKSMADLFEHGKTGLNHPIKFVYIEGGNVGEYPASVAFSVSKKKFRKAVDRNLLKRRMREAYRLNKSLFYTKLKDKTVKVMFRKLLKN